MKLKLTIILLCVAVASQGNAQDRATATHGTINVLLANRNGAVLVTDSRTSFADYRKASDHSKKLFKLDDHSVCSIAGFFSNTGPELTGAGIRVRYPLFVSIDGLMRSYERGIAGAGYGLSVRQKADSVSELVGFS